MTDPTPTQLAADVRANTHRLRDMIGFALAEKNIPHEPTWTLLAPQALDNIDVALDALVARITDLEARLRCLQLRLHVPQRVPSVNVDDIVVAAVRRMQAETEREQWKAHNAEAYRRGQEAAEAQVAENRLLYEGAAENVSSYEKHTQDLKAQVAALTIRWKEIQDLARRALAATEETQ